MPCGAARCYAAPVPLPRQLRVLPLLALSATLHCGPAAPEFAHGLSERTMARVARAPAVYAPAGPPGGVQDAESAAMTATFEAALEPQARSRVRHDPALDLVAAALAENFSDQGRDTTGALCQWLFWKSGSVALYHSYSGGYVAKRARGHGSSSLEAWTRRAAEALNTTPTGALSYGLSRFTEGRVTAEMIVFGAAPFEVSTLAKTYAPGGPLTLALRPRTPFREIRLSIGSDGAVEEHLLTPREDGSFFFAGPVPSRPGRYFVEVEGPPPARATLMWFPIHVGVPEPTTPDAFLQSPPPAPTDAAAWPAWLAARYDAERARLGRPPMQIDVHLAAFAAERSLMAAAGRRVAPSDADSFATRLRTLGLTPAGFFETVTVAGGADSVLFRLQRPSVRRRVVLPARVLFGGAAAPRPVTDEKPQTFSVVEETVIP